MPVIQNKWKEGDLEFAFPREGQASKYDNWAHYRNQFQRACGGQKAVDFVFFGGTVAWLIEVKDYRQNKRTKAIDLADEISIKARDTLAGLVSTCLRASDEAERNFARAVLQAQSMRVVCHLEQPTKHSRLRPRAIDIDKLQLKLRANLKWIDPHTMVVDKNSLHPSMHWRVS